MLFLFYRRSFKRCGLVRFRHFLTKFEENGLDRIKNVKSTLLNQLHLRTVAKDPKIQKYTDDLIQSIEDHYKAVKEVFGDQHPIQITGPKQDVITINFSGEPKPTANCYAQMKCFDIEVGAYDLEKVETPTGHDYVKKVPRGFRSTEEAYSIFNESVKEVEGITQTLKNLSQSFGWNATEGSTLSFGNLGKSIKIRNPENTVLLYRGIRGNEQQLAKLMKEGTSEGFLPNNYSSTELETALKDFQKNDINNKINWMNSQVLHRKLNEKSPLIGATENLDVAKYFGDVVYELRVPKEVTISSKNTGFYGQESEVFIPFAIHPSWIERIVKKDGTVIWQKH